MKIKKIFCVLIIFSLIASMFIPMTVSANPVIVSVEVTQILGKGIDIDNGKYHFMNMFVAEKPTAIQVVMTGDVSASSATLDIYYEGSLLTTARPEESGSSQILTFIPGKDAINAWKAGRYKFTANVNGSSKTTEAIFNESRTFSVLIISAAVKHNGRIYDAPDLKADTVTLRAQPLPVSESKFIRKFRSAKLNFGTGNNGYDLSASEGQMSILSDIEKYRSMSASQYDVVVCVVNAPLEVGAKSGNATTAGYTNSRHAIVMTLNGNPDAEEKESTLLHELGHIFGNGDEYIGGSFKLSINGAPYGIRGTSNGASVTGDKIYFKNVDGNDYSGIKIEDAQNPYNPKTSAPMYNRTSFMGSSYKHWTTSMVWEQSYKFFVPNYNNVLPKVYTDGSIVAKRPTNNTMSEAENEQLANDFIKMLNEVRAEKGLAPYPNDIMMRAGNKRLRETAVEELAAGNIDNLFRLDPMLNSVRADTNQLFTNAQMETSLDEFRNSYTEDKRDFFTNHPCGLDWISKDYMFVAFVRTGNTTYITWSTLSGVYDNPPDEERFKPQPETIPIPEVNPVTDEVITPEMAKDILETDSLLPNNGGSTVEQPTERPTEKPTEAPTQAPTQTPPKIEANPYAEAYARGERPGFGWDMFDYGLGNAKRSNPESWVDGDMSLDDVMEDVRKFEYTLGFYAWYLNDNYGLNLTAADVEKAISSKGSFGENPPLDLACQYYELYPPQEFREDHWWYDYGVERKYGNNPKRSKYDKDTIKYRESGNGNDSDIFDPDGGW